MRGICLLINYKRSSSGADKSILNLVPALRKKDIHLSVVSVKNRRELLKSLIAAGPSLLFANDFLLVNAFGAVYRRATGWFLKWARFFNIPVIYWNRETQYQLSRQKPKALEAMQRLLAHPKIQIISNSEFSRAEFQERFSRPSHVVGNHGLVKDIPSPDSLAGDEKRDLKRIVNLASLQPRKNPGLFFETAVICCKNDEEVSFSWHGDGPELDRYREKAKSAGLEDRILFPGFTPAIEPVLKESRLLFLTSLSESYCQSVAQAMAFGLEILLLQGSGGPEWITQGNAETLLTNAPQEAAEKILSIISSPFKVRKDFMHLYEREHSLPAHTERVAKYLRDLKN